MDSLKLTSGSLLLILLILSILWKLLLPTLLERWGVIVEGYVFDRGKVYGRFGTIYYLKYTYHYGRKSYSHRQKVDKDTYHIWSEIGEAKVRCLPVLPFIACLEV